MSMDKIVLSGIRPTGDLHLGNYFGAIRYFVQLQQTNRCFYFVADLHALTTAMEERMEIATLSVEVVRWYLACGVNPDRALIYRQSDIPEIPYLTLLLGMIAPEGELRRCTTYKEKVGDLEEKKRLVSVGLLSYPVLMAADILFCNANWVPVGEDQLQHLEIAREVARRYNAHFGQAHRFVEPQPHILEPVKVPGLSGEGKMSKSVGGPDNAIFLCDPPKEVLRKIKAAKSDTGPAAGQTMPVSVQNLYALLKLCARCEVYDQYLAMYNAGEQKFYGALKQDLAQAVNDLLAPIQARFASSECSEKRVREMLQDNIGPVRAVAAQTLHHVLKDMKIEA
jgi:tryptophanyl-tRNA synthetase